MYEFLVREANFQFCIKFWKKDKRGGIFSSANLFCDT